MLAGNTHHPRSAITETCRGNCPGYGSRCCCPPLIVLAMHAQHLPDEPCHHTHIDEAGVARRPRYSAAGLASGEFCNCMFAYQAHEAGSKIEL